MSENDRKLSLSQVPTEDLATRVIREKIGSSLEGTGPAHEPRKSSGLSPELKALEGKIIEALKTVYDPEIPLNIYDLGLVYAILVGPEADVKIEMTLTAPGCPVAGTIVMQVRNAVKAVPGVSEAYVDLVWEPVWTRDMLSEAARLELGLM